MKRSALGILLVALGVISLIYVLNTGGNNLLKDLFSFASKEVKLEESADVSTIGNITIETSSTNVHVVKGTGSKAVIRLQGRASRGYNEQDRFEVTSSDDTLTVKTTGKHRNWVLFGWNNIRLTIELPEKVWNKVTVDAGSGNIEFDELTAERLDIEGRSGNLKIDRAKASELNAELSSGNMTLKQIESDNIELKILSGNMKLDRYAAEQVTFEASSGNASLIDGHAKLIGKVTSGNIKVESSDLQYDADLQTRSGNVNIELDRTPASMKIDYRGGSGRGKIEKDGFVYDIKSNERDIITGSFGKGDLKLTVRTGSGNFTLEK